MSMSMFEVFPTIGLTKISLSILGFNVFATSLTYKMVVREKRSNVTYLLILILIFYNQQFIIWGTKAVHGSYFVTIYI